MRIDKFVSSLLPSFKKDTLREDIANIREELVSRLTPVYGSAVQTLAKHQFTSREVVGFDRNWSRQVRTEFRGNFIVVIHQTLLRLQENLPAIEKLVERYYMDDTYKDGLTYLKANLLQYIELIGFTLKYARRLLNFVIWEEVATEDKQSGLVGQGPNKAERDWLVTNASHFYTAINTLAVKRNVIEKSFNEIPDAIANPENVAEIEATVGVGRVDPFRMGFIPVWLNPIYHVRMRIAEYQVARYNEQKEEIKLLEFRLLNLRQRQTGEIDPRIEQQIEYTEGRLDKLRYKVAQLEEEYA